MISDSDIIHLPYTSDLTEGGIAYALRSLPYTYNRMGGSQFERLRRIVAGVAVELAFRRYLSSLKIPFDVKGATPFTEPDRYDVSLGGHRCDVKSFLITYRKQIAEMRRAPQIILSAPALVPVDQHKMDGYSDHDVYIFAFLTGLISSVRRDLEKVRAAGQPFYLMYPMKDSWRQPKAWRPLGRLSLKSESDAALTVEIGGQDEGRGFLTRSVELRPRARVVVDDPFFSLAYFHVDKIPSARLGVHCAGREETCLINPHEWGNIWVYGMDILFAGYISRKEFDARARMIPSDSRVFQYDRTRAKNLAVNVSELKPLPDLFGKVRKWVAVRGRK